MTILHSILKMASPGEGWEIKWPEAHHPKRGKFRVIGLYIDPVLGQMVQMNDGKSDYNFDAESFVLEGFRIIAHNFAHLVEQVKADPVDNAAVRAASLHLFDEYREARAFHDADGVYQYIGVGLHFMDFKITKDWKFSSRGYEQLTDYAQIIQSFRSEGYACGIPTEHVITPEEVKNAH